MRFLIDEAISWRVATSLNEAGHDAKHVSELGLLGLADTRIMRAAFDDDRVVVAADTDFGELLALGRHPGPSVVILRRAPHRPEQQAALLLNSLERMGDSLALGAVAVLASGRVRIRMLPIQP